MSALRLLLLLALSLPALATAVPQQIAHQGQLYEQGSPVTGTVEIAFRLFDAATDGGSVIAALGCAHDLCRIGRADTAAELLAQLDLTELEGRYPQCQQRHIGAAVDGDVDALTDVVDGFVSLGAPHLAAEAATDAARSPAATARDRRRLLQRAAEVSTGDSGGVEQLAAQVGLTRREHDVVALAALGLTSREAADRLSISRRTVETHLGNAYQKLGVNDRLGLLERLRPST